MKKISKKIIFPAFIMAAFSLVFLFPQKAHAIPVHETGANLIQNVLTAIQTEFTTMATDGTLSEITSEYLTETFKSQALLFAKVSALEGIRAATASLMGENGGLVITDYNEYLYKNPRQQAVARMNTFFDTISDGRISSIRYEGVGPNYDSYLASQAKKPIVAKAPSKTNLQEYVTNPNQLFSGGNMKGAMAYMQCTNNVSCLTFMSNGKFNEEFEKAKSLAKAEDQGGFRPQKSENGRIIKPAELAKNALLEVDDLGTELIMKAGEGDQQYFEAYSQILAGGAISLASRAANYGVIDNHKDVSVSVEFPFSLGYEDLGT